MESVGGAGCDAFSLLRLSWPKLSGDDITGGRKVCVTLLPFFGPLSFWQCHSWNIPSLLGSYHSKIELYFVLMPLILTWSELEMNAIWAKTLRLFKTRATRLTIHLKLLILAWSELEMNLILATLRSLKQEAQVFHLQLKPMFSWIIQSNAYERCNVNSSKFKVGCQRVKNSKR